MNAYLVDLGATRHPKRGVQNGSPWPRLLVWLLILYAHCASAQVRSNVTLTTTVSIENLGAQSIPIHHFRLTLPVTTPPHQHVLSVQWPQNARFHWRQHPNQVDRYAETQLSLAPHSTVQLVFKTQLRLQTTDWIRDGGDHSTAGNAQFLRPTAYVESTAPEIQRLAARFRQQSADPAAQLNAAFQYPQRSLRYQRDMPNNFGALFALRQGYGDCTEYAALFVATARAMGYPARLTSEFHFEPGIQYDQPNHHAAEVFVHDQWIPVDPNLATAPHLGYGFGTTGVQKIMLKRDGSWVWASSTPGVNAAYRERFLKTSVRWRVAPSE